MSNRNENLLKNTAIFALGNFGSKLLQLILVPYYTRAMTNAEYGTADILQAIVTLLMPIFCLTIYEGVFRYAMEKECDKTSVLTTGVVISCIGGAVLCILGAVAYGIYPNMFVWLVVFNTVTGFFRSLYSQYTRAVGKVGLFTVDNVLITACVLGLNILFISVLNLGVNGYILGYSIANLISCIILISGLGEYRKLRFRSIEKPLLKQMLLFSIPLIPNTICWWISNFVDRVYIISMIDSAANGLYAASHKIPSLLTLVVTIFFQAWQMSANEEFKSHDISDFYSSIFEQIFAVISLISSVLILLCRPIVSVFLGAEFQNSWSFIPGLMLAMTFFSYAQFLGSIYSANKKTTMALVTNAVAVVVNVILNYVFILWLGTLGAAVATAISYLVLWIIRIFDTGKIVPIKYDVKRIVTVTALLTVQAVIITCKIKYGYVISALITVSMLVILRKTLMNLVGFAVSLIRKFLHKGNNL